RCRRGPPAPHPRRRGELLRVPGGRPVGGRPAQRPLVDGGDRRRRANSSRMSSRTCPDWPKLMELAPELQFKHYTQREAQLPADALVSLGEVSSDEVTICCDLDSHVFNPEHTE